MAQTLNTKIVLRNDSSTNWLDNETVVLLKGEVGIEFFADGKVKMKIGDGVASWSELPYFGGEEGKTFTVNSLDEITDTELAVGDTAIVKTLIANNKYSYTGYVWNGEAWSAMDGNYSATNVYFDQDLVTTSAIGNITLTNGQATISAEGKNLKQVFDTIFVKEKNPSTTQPSASVTLSNAGAKEVGSTFTPSYNASLSAGSYTYGPATGVVAESYTVTDTNGGSASTRSGSFAPFVVEEDTSYKVSVSITHNEGTIPVTNTGNEYATGQIAAGTKTNSSSSVTGYRAWFYGYKGADSVLDITNLTSANIRALTASNGSIPSSLTTEKMQQMFFAAPAGKIKSVSVANATNGAPQTVTKTSVSVEGANGYTAVAYDVYYVSNATAESGSTKFNITISK